MKMSFGNHRASLIIAASMLLLPVTTNAIEDLRLDSIWQVGIQVTGLSTLIQSNTLSNMGGNCIDEATGIALYPNGSPNRVINNAIYNVTNNPQHPRVKMPLAFWCLVLGQRC